MISTPLGRSGLVSFGRERPIPWQEDAEIRELVGVALMGMVIVVGTEAIAIYR